MVVSRKPRLYLHIGYHKTGTTAIQEGLYYNRDALAKHGYYYPQIGLQGYGQHEISWALKSEKSFRAESKIVEQLLDEMSKADSEKFIISSETFCAYGIPQVRRLGSIFSEYETKIVVYLRRQDQFLQAVWAQQVKVGTLAGHFEEWLLANLTGKPVQPDAKVVPPLDYHQALMKWADVFGQENLVIRPYERGQLAPDILCDFLKTCELEDCHWVQKASVTNVTPSLKTLEIIRAVAISTSTTLPHQPLRFENVKLLYAMIRDYADAHGWNDANLNLITPELYHQIMQRFHESNQAVAQQYFGRSQLFYAPIPDGEAQTYDLTTTSGLEILDLLVPILAEMTHRVIDRHDQLLQVEHQIHAMNTYVGIVRLVDKVPILFSILTIVVKMKRRLVRLLRSIEKAFGAKIRGVIPLAERNSDD
jgi:hypothetical protein